MLDVEGGTRALDSYRGASQPASQHLIKARRDATAGSSSVGIIPLFPTFGNSIFSMDTRMCLASALVLRNWTFLQVKFVRTGDMMTVSSQTNSNRKMLMIDLRPFFFPLQLRGTATGLGGNKDGKTTVKINHTVEELLVE